MIFKVTFGTPISFNVTVLKFGKVVFFYPVMAPKIESEMTNSADPDQTAPFGAV